ncbi:chaperonin [Serratia sp. NPDC078593]|uniref:chaperonin n=1 Tax=unclassified Serratia (in: enterobacteria) TaxID=2647522 RepID=UPI0037D113F6
MSKISERLKHARISEGYCVICGSFGHLSKDHVPPRCATTIQPMFQKTVSEHYSSEEIKPINAHAGATFKTICKHCNNNLLGTLDADIKKPIEKFLLEIKKYITGTHYYGNTISVPFNAIPFLRAMIGHLLAATSVEVCKKGPIDSDFYTPLREFVLGRNIQIEDTHDFYYWFYPNKTQITAQLISFFNNGHICHCSCMHFFPMAFLITFKGEGTYPAHSTKLNVDDRNLYFNMTQGNLDYVAFPFVPLRGNQMTVMTSSFTSASYPQK